MVLDKRTPVSEELWERLGKMKQAGETYDELLGEIIQKTRRKELADRMDEDELRSLEVL